MKNLLWIVPVFGFLFLLGVAQYTPPGGDMVATALMCLPVAGLSLGSGILCGLMLTGWVLSQDARAAQAYVDVNGALDEDRERIRRRGEQGGRMLVWGMVLSAAWIVGVLTLAARW